MFRITRIVSDPSPVRCGFSEMRPQPCPQQTEAVFFLRTSTENSRARSVLKIKLGQCFIQSRPLWIETGSSIVAHWPYRRSYSHALRPTEAALLGTVWISRLIQTEIFGSLCRQLAISGGLFFEHHFDLRIRFLSHHALEIERVL